MALFSGAIIDMDGTLLDSMGTWEKIDREFLELRRGIAVPDDYMAAITPLGYRETALYTIARFNLPDTPEQLMEEWNRMAAKEYAENINPKPHAAEFLHALKDMGVKMALCTSSPEMFYAPALKRLGFYDMFGGFATTGEAGKSKSFPDVYCLAAEKIAVPPQSCIAFEDIPEAIAGAHAAGMKICGVYDRYSAKHTQIMRSRCDSYVEDLADAIKIFES